MRALRATGALRAVRRKAVGRLPRAGRAVLVCVPGLAAVAALVLCVLGVERAVESGGRGTEARSAGHRAARPAIVPRERWLGDTGSARAPARYGAPVVAVFVHHTDSPNRYDCADVPRIIRALAEGQTRARLFDDIGYNFLVDRCGTIYEGRGGGVDRPVVGAHTQGFNQRTAGVAAIGTFTAGVPVPAPMAEAIAALAAWKLGLADADPRRTARLVSSNSLSRFPAGAHADFQAVSGHADGYSTHCPGAALRAELPAIRERAAALQGRTSARAAAARQG
ncbi:peptidoglycan recognition protein family protein [Streptomyces silvensis]|uniref:peptidoglycan recognition protein family protein n=1 Tax=Streptomyces silvensis TaxID=1765722 RepID=UPI00099EE227|nr:peptidoglycan recognition protein [Streptomyces silvensis]